MDSLTATEMPPLAFPVDVMATINLKVFKEKICIRSEFGFLETQNSWIEVAY